MSCDMLVKLYDLSLEEVLRAEKETGSQGVTLKRAMPPDLTRIRQYVLDNFSAGWADECTAGVLKNGCWLAVRQGEIVGFACFEATMKDYFGPTGVTESMRGKGIGKALLLKCLWSMKEMGYNYAVIGWTGPQEFYHKVCGAVPIPDSIPASYSNMVGIDR